MDPLALTMFWTDFVRAYNLTDDARVERALVSHLRDHCYTGDIASVEAVAEFGEMLARAVHTVTSVPA